MSNRLLSILYLPFRLLIISVLSAFFLLRLSLQVITQRSSSVMISELIKRYFESLGGSFIKVGQTLAMRPDFFSIEFCETLSSLLDNVPPFRKTKGVKIIERELRAPINTLFPTFDPTPVAAASFGQVYRGKDVEGNVVAIKVMRPGIEHVVFADIFFLRTLNFVFSLTGIGRRLGTDYLIEEIIDILKGELDYRSEAQSIKISQINAENIPFLRVPRLYEQYSTRRVLCMEFLEGIWVKDVLSSLRKNGGQDLLGKDGKHIDTVALSNRMFTIGMRAVFENNYFHADPHSANILVMRDDEIGYIDYGIMGWTTSQFRKQQIEYFKAIASGDVDSAVDAFTSFLVPQQGSDFKGFKRSVRILLQLWMHSTDQPDAPMREKSTAPLLLQSLHSARQFRFHLPMNVVRYFRSILIVEGIILELNPSFRMRVALDTYFARLSMLQIKNLMRFDKMFERGITSIKLLFSFPYILESVSNNVRALERASEVVQKGFNNFFRYASEVFYFLAFLFILMRIFLRINNVAPLIGLNYEIDYKFAVLVMLYIAYRLDRIK